MNTFQITSEVSQAFPDIQEELCSKHTILLNQLQNKFKLTYPNHDPTHYVLTQHPHHLLTGSHTTITMAMQQGVTIIIAPSSHQENIHLSDSHHSSLTLTNNGKIINAEQQEELSLIAKKAIELGVDDLSLNKTKGGFLYWHSHLTNLKEIKNDLIIGLFMGTLIINGILQQYSIDELISKLKSLEEFKNNQIVQDYFLHYRNRGLVVHDHDQTSIIPLNNKYKLLFINFSAFNSEIYVQTSPQFQIDQLIGQFKQGQIELIQLMTQVYQAQLPLKDERVTVFVDKMINDFKLKGVIVSGEYLVMAVERYRYAEIISKISRYIHTTIPPTAPQPQDTLKTRHSQSNLQTLLFSSVPTQGLTILDPSKQVWY